MILKSFAVSFTLCSRNDSLDLQVHHLALSYFCQEENSDLRMVCDYRALNAVTIRDRNPLPLIDEALDQVSGACWFSSLELVAAYHQMHIRDSDCHKTEIRTRYGSFEWRVLCFGLTSAPAAFMRLISSVLHELNGVCVIIFLDDVLVYSKSKDKHERHLRMVLD
eukprot:IDg3129t1